MMILRAVRSWFAPPGRDEDLQKSREAIEHGRSVDLNARKAITDARERSVTPTIDLIRGTYVPQGRRADEHRA